MSKPEVHFKDSDWTAEMIADKVKIHWQAEADNAIDNQLKKLYGHLSFNGNHVVDACKVLRRVLPNYKEIFQKTTLAIRNELSVAGPSLPPTKPNRRGTFDTPLLGFTLAWSAKDRQVQEHHWMTESFQQVFPYLLTYVGFEERFDNKVRKSDPDCLTVYKVT